MCIKITFIVIVCVGISKTSALADESSKERFENDILPLVVESENSNKGVAMPLLLELVNHGIGKSESTGEDIYEFDVHLSNAIFDDKHVKVHSKSSIRGIKKESIDLFNKNYNARLEKMKGASEFHLAYVRAIDEPPAHHQFNYFMSLASRKPAISQHLFLTLGDLLSSENYAITDAVELESGHWEVHFANNAYESESTSPTNFLEIIVVIDIENGSKPIESNLRSDDFQIVSKFEYDGKGVIGIGYPTQRQYERSGSNSDTKRSELLRVTSTASDLGMMNIEECYLAYYGFPEPPQFQSRNSRVWWIAGLFTMLFVCRFLVKKKKEP